MKVRIKQDICGGEVMFKVEALIGDKWEWVGIFKKLSTAKQVALESSRVKFEKILFLCDDGKESIEE